MTDIDDDRPRPVRIRLPERKEVEAMTDIAKLEELLDEVEKAIAKMETDLDFAPEENEWFIRAKKALQRHRYTRGLLQRQLKALKRPEQTPKQGAGPVFQQARVRPISEAVTELLDEQYPTFDSTEDTVEAMADALDDLSALKRDVEQERDAEIVENAPAQRDEVWLYRVNAGLKRLGSERHKVAIRHAELLRIAKREQQGRRDMSTERLFIAVARETLPKALYESLWAEANRRHAESLLEASNG